jgi:hypothetical protein
MEESYEGHLQQPDVLFFLAAMVRKNYRAQSTVTGTHSPYVLIFADAHLPHAYLSQSDEFHEGRIRGLARVEAEVSVREL